MKKPNSMSELLAEEIGWHLGDGSMNWYNGKGLYQLRGHLKDDRAHYEMVIKSAFEKLFDIKVNLREMKSTGVYGFQLWSDELVRFKQSLGLPLGPKGEYFIPQEILNKKKFIISVIRGIFDTDGMLFLEKKRDSLYPRIEIKQTSKLLSDQLYQELLNLGFRVTMYIDGRGNDKWLPLYVISVRGHQMLLNWFQMIKPNNPKHNKKYEFYRQYYENRRKNL